MRVAGAGRGIKQEGTDSMRYTKRSRKGNIQRILKWYCKEGKISELDIALDFPELTDIMDGDEELDFDDVVRAFDYIGVDLVAIPRSETRKMEWYTITDMPFDDGGKNREPDALTQKRKRAGKAVGKSGRGRPKERK